MTCLPGETKETIIQNRKWMKAGNSLKNPIHFNNGLWYACGQFFYPYKYVAGGVYLDGELARVRPTWIPNSLGLQDYEIIDLEKTNLYTQLAYGMKIYNPKMAGNILEFIDDNQDRAAWLLTGIRCGGII